MKILLLMANANMHKFHLGSHVRSSREAPLSLSTLAALTRDRPEIEYQLVDESVDPVPLDARPDLVGISVMTGTARRAYALADHFRSKGIRVVLGGVHATLRPDEAARFGDSVVVGMAETIWPQVVADAAAGRLQPRYQQPPEDSEWLIGSPTPRWELMRKSGYMMPYTVQLTRGCVHRCDFCTVPGVWSRFQKRPVADVVRDVAAVPSRRFAISDVSPFDDLEYTKELLTALIPLKKKWGGLATSRIADDPEVVELLRRSGCNFLLIGFESVNQAALNHIRKGFNKSDQYAELMRTMHQAGISVQGTFVFGFDEDGPDVFARTVDWVQELRVDIPRYSIYTPYPGSALFDRLQREGRILSLDWADYDTMHVVIRPAGMTPVELYEGFRWAYRQTFRIRNILHRTMASGRNFPIAFAGNLTYRIFVKRLDRGKGFEMPVGSLPPGPA
ncbi:MAG: radical SAM protein [Myxococcota bacterium]|jgi:radical SAM superfamily enzyme YgiQ (UPF0313 family)|nr:radical SAM protein [Myxococcota bacterium]